MNPFQLELNPLLAASDYATLIQAAYAGQEQLAAVGRRVSDGDLVLRVRGPADYIHPAFGVFVWHKYQTTVTVVAGTETFAQGNAFSVDSVLNFRPPGGGKTNATFFRAAERILTIIEERGLQFDERNVFVGHSYGGAVAEIAAILSRRRGRNAAYMTFGSPKIGDHKFCERLANIDGTRIMNQNDPVPYLPFRVSTGVPPFLSAPELLLTLLQTTEWSQPGRGVELRPGGAWSFKSLPDLVGLGQEAMTVAWLASKSGEGPARHAIRFYVDRCLAAEAVALTEPVPEPSDVFTSGEPFVAGGETEDSDGLSPSFILPFSERREPTMNSFRYNPSAVRVPKRRRASIANVNGQYFVALDGQAIIKATTRFAARRIASKLEALFNFMLASDGVDINGFLTAFGGVLNAALVADSGFSPTLIGI